MTPISDWQLRTGICNFDRLYLYVPTIAVYLLCFDLFFAF